MGIKKIISLLLVILIPTIFFAGCGNKVQAKYGYDINYTINTVDSQIIAQNSNLILHWDDNLKCILLENRLTGKIWSNIPMKNYEEGEICSTLEIAARDMKEYQAESFSGETVQRENKISCEKIENGIRLTYYFDKAEMAVPVEYVLREDSMLVSIDGAKIQEKGDRYRLTSVSVAPFLCSVANNTENSYLFVPEGNGGLMYTNVDVDGVRKIATGTVNSASHDVSSQNLNSVSSGIRVFGIKVDNEALVGIPEETWGAISVTATAGDKKGNYANIHPVFCFVDYDYFYAKGKYAGTIMHISDRCMSKVSVGYYPLSNEEANYNGMAKRYRKYLTDNGYIEEKNTSSSPYSLTVLGGVLTSTSILGIPVKTLKSMTNYTQAQEIIEDITTITGIKPVVRLRGYTESGINYGEIAGGYKFSSKLGNEKQRKALEDYCLSNDISMYFDFELLKYSKSGSGFSYSKDTAKTAILYPAEQTGVNPPLRDANINMTCRILKRSKIEEAVEKLAKMINKKNISGVNLSSLGGISYSDYSDGVKYAASAGMEEDTKEYIQSLKKTNVNIASSSAAAFAAGIVDTVFDAPLGLNGKYQLDEEIPFYQMVFSGITPLYSSAVNLSTIPEEKIMMAAATGTGLGFTVIKDFEKTFMETAAEKLYACKYESNTELIKTALDKYNEVYKAINNSNIKSYDILENNITKTVFENGVVIYANRSSDTVNSPIGELSGFDFRMEREGV